MTVIDPDTEAIASWFGGVSARALERHGQFSEKRVVLVGELPFARADLGSLLPPGCECQIDRFPTEGSVDYFVIGQGDTDEPYLDRCLKAARESTRFLPQEGFVDELLFGYDWWCQNHDLLDDACAYYPGLAYVREQAAKYSFEWPSVTAQSVEQPVGDDGRVRESETTLHRLGYNSQLDPTRRWTVLRRILDDRQMGLKEVANTIAWYCRHFRRMHNGEVRFVRALGAWETDLTRLKRNYYDPHRPLFKWPSSR